MSPSTQLTLHSLADTQKLAALVAAQLKPSTTVFLSGGLGAGKTTFVRLCLDSCAALQEVAPPRTVPSPSFTLLQPYQLGSLSILHADLWRIENPTDALDLALGEEAHLGSVLLVEWAEHGTAVLPRADLTLVFNFVDSDPNSSHIHTTANPPQEIASEQRVVCLEGALAQKIIEEFKSELVAKTS